jgi:putative FmdB family regulatory protein
MPTYTYRCTQCAGSFDLGQKISDEPLRTCPQCQGSLRRVPHPVGLVFKGSGFYSTDSRAHQPTPQAASASTAA